MQKVKLWDLPTRLFHWILVIAMVGLFISGQIGGNAIELHGKVGQFVLALIVFRVVWGFVGSTYARFTSFFPTPTRILAYLRGEWSGLGHNPLGSLSVFALLGLVGLQAVLGLFSNDDIAFRGPLFRLIDSDLSSSLTGWHQLLSNVLIALVVIHVAAIVFYTHVKKEDIVKPMVTGWKEVKAGEHARGGGVVALMISLVFAGFVFWGSFGSWVPEPPPPPPASTPAW